MMRKGKPVSWAQKIATTATLESRSLNNIIGQSGRGGTNGSVRIWKEFGRMTDLNVSTYVCVFR